MKKVSVIIPLYNAGVHLHDSVKSVLDQEYPDVEIVIVDDGSSDDSLSYVPERAAVKTRIFKQTNRGACAARNLGISKSTGDYFQFLDADDVLSQNKISEQVQVLNKFGEKTLVACPWDRFANDISEATFPARELYRDFEITLDWFKIAWLKDDMMTSHAWLIPRKLIEMAGKWNEKLKINQDGEFMSRVIRQSEKILFTPEAKVYYRSGNSGSITKNYLKREKAESLLDSYILYVENLRDQLDDEEIRKALARNFLGFIYQYFPHFPDLIEKAKGQIKTLKVNKVPLVGGSNFRKIAKVIGFDNALTLRKYT